jgi:LCP family protein required for cell wall assembly
MTNNYRGFGTGEGRSRSLDGFVPNNQGRHVGFNVEPPRRGSLDGNARPRMRRPGLHQAPALNIGAGRGSAMPSNTNAGTASTMRTGMSRDLPQLTTYNTTRTTGRAANDGHGRRSDFTGGSTLGLGSDSDTNGKHGRLSRREQRRQKKQEQQRFSRNSRNGHNSRGGRNERINRRHGIAWKKIFKRTALAMLALVLVTGGWLGWRLVRTSSKVFGDSGNVVGFLRSTPLKGEDKGRVNILLAGVSTDDPGHEGADLTDSIMLVSLDTTNHKAFLLSIPRDLWVNIPGNGHSKINAANAFGDTGKWTSAGYPAGGMGLLEKVLAQNLEIPIHYYAKINYSAFKDGVNAVGGITVNIQSSDPRGLYDPNINKQDNGPLKLPNGVQKLDGQTALNLARARGDPTGDGRVAYGFARSDFDRTEHQRLMLLALKEKITSGGVITNPLKISDLFDVVAKNVTTDFQPSEIRRLYDINKQIPSNGIDSLSLNDANGVNLLASYHTPNGQSALAPAAGPDNFSQIQAYLKKMMTNDPVVKEGAKVVVLNGGTTDGLATKFSDYLTAKGLDVVAVDSAPPTPGPNVIIDQTTKKTNSDGSVSSGKPGTKARLLQIFGSNSGSVTTAKVGYPSADFIVILGTDQKPPASSSTSSTGSAGNSGSTSGN